MNLPNELENATEQQYYSYVRKLLSKGRMGFAPVDGMKVLHGLNTKLHEAIRANKAELRATPPDELPEWLSNIAERHMQFDDPALGPVTVGYVYHHRLSELQDFLRRSDLLRPEGPKYNAEEERQPKRNVQDKEVAKSKQELSDIPDLKALSICLRSIDSVWANVELEKSQQHSLQTLRTASEWLLLNGPKLSSLTATAGKKSELPSLTEIKSWEPQKFFKWFHAAIVDTPRKELTGLSKAWLKEQAGKHGYADLDPSVAVDRKKELAKQTMEVIEALGLGLLCTAADCGQPARLSAKKTGNSRSGQFYFSHRADAPGSTATHNLTKEFPHLTFA